MGQLNSICTAPPTVASARLAAAAAATAVVERPPMLALIVTAERKHPPRARSAWKLASTSASRPAALYVGCPPRRKGLLLHYRVHYSFDQTLKGGQERRLYTFQKHPGASKQTCCRGLASCLALEAFLLLSQQQEQQERAPTSAA
jgi:hypothetical protein